MKGGKFIKKMSLEKIAQSYQPVAEINTSGLYQLCTGGTHIKMMPLSRGMNLGGGLKIKDFNKNTVTLQQDFGDVGDIYTFHPDGHGAHRFYGNEYVNRIKQGKKRETKIRSW